MRSISWCSWADFAAASPRLASQLRTLFEQYGQGYGYLATVRRDGGPRVHPVSPVIADNGLFCFVLDSPKRRDLERDGRYALHAYPPELTDDEAYLSGRARPVMDKRRREKVARAHRASPDVDWLLFELDIEIAMLTHRERSVRLAAHQVWLAAADRTGAAGTPARQSRPAPPSRRTPRSRRVPPRPAPPAGDDHDGPAT
jgi:hypothetical protein